MRTRVINFIPVDGYKSEVIIYEIRPRPGRCVRRKRPHIVTVRSAFRLLRIVNRWLTNAPAQVSVQLHFYGWNASIHEEV